MKKVEVLFNADGKRIVLMVDEKLYHFKQRLDKNGVKVLEQVGWFYYGKPLRDGFIIDAIVTNGNKNSDDKEMLLFYALGQLGMRETPYIKTGRRTSQFNRAMATQILENIITLGVRNDNKILTNF